MRPRSIFAIAAKPPLSFSCSVVRIIARVRVFCYLFDVFRVCFVMLFVSIVQLLFTTRERKRAAGLIKKSTSITCSYEHVHLIIRATDRDHLFFQFHGQHASVHADVKMVGLFISRHEDGQVRLGAGAARELDLAF